MKKNEERQPATKKDLVELRMELGKEMATKKDLMELRKEMATKKDVLFLHAQIQEHDNWLIRMEGKLDKTVHIVQQMCDKVLKGYENFSVESVAIKDNYQRLESRLAKVEKVVFPNN